MVAKRVQWAESNDVLNALDEAGQDPSAFQSLTTALEQHESSPASTPTSSEFTPPPPAAVNSSASLLQRMAPSHTVPGEGYIHPDERDGLPLSQPPRNPLARAEDGEGGHDADHFARALAGRVVRAHTGRRWWGFNHSRGARRRRGEAREQKEKEKEKERSPSPSPSSPENNTVPPSRPRRLFPTGLFNRATDTEGPTVSNTRSNAHTNNSTPASSRPSSFHAPQLGTGVLSALLALYHDDSGASTPSGTLVADSEYDSEDIEAPSKPWVRASGTSTPAETDVEDIAETARTSSRGGSGTDTPASEADSTPDIAVAPPSDTDLPDTSEPTTGKRRRKAWNGVHLSLPHIPHPHLPNRGHAHGLSLPGTPFAGISFAGGSKNSTPGSSHDPASEWIDEKWVDRADREAHEAREKDQRDLKEKERNEKDRERRERKEWQRREKDRKEKEREKRRKRKKTESYITHHISAVLQRQQFLLKLARTLMMFGGPSHRLPSQIQATARVLDVELSCMYLPDVMLISFEDSATGTSNVRFVRQGSVLDLGKLADVYGIYWDVTHDRQSVSSASASLDALMHKKPIYNQVQLVIIGGLCSAAICSVSFSGSLIDSLISAPLGALLVVVQMLSARNELYGNVFEITIATLLSFVSAALASTYRFCYSAVASSSVVLILPGFIVLLGSLELTSRSLIAGAVRLCYALMYSLFLGFGLAIGAETYQKMAGKTVVGATDYTCMQSHDPLGPWWQRTPGLWWACVGVPVYSIALSLRCQAPVRKIEFVLLITISCIGWVTNHFVSIKFPSQSDISAAVGAFAVGFLSNLYGRFFNGNAFVVMITGILFQLPSGLGNGGLLNFVSDQTSGSSTSYLGGFQVALQLISVSIGLTVGLGISLVVVHPVLSRRKGSGVFSL